MSGLNLYSHPFSLFSQKALIALYETGTPFTPQTLDSANPDILKEYGELWPIGRFPVLRDDARSITLPESSIIIEHLDLHYPGELRLIPADPDQALQARLWDRVFDNYVAVSVLKIVSDRARAPESKDPEGVKEAREMLAKACSQIEKQLAGKTWAIGAAFTLADCAAAPALYYANWVQPFGDDHVALKGYFGRLLERPSFARVLEEAKPYRELFPTED